MKAQVFKYGRVYLHILKLTFSALLEYRLDMLVRSSYAFVYILGVFFMIKTAFMFTTTIGGFDATEVYLLYGSVIVGWGVMELLFFDGYKYFMLQQISTGQFDMYLTKPINALFLASFSKPRLESFFYIIVLGAFFLSQVWHKVDQLSPLSVVLFLLLWINGMYIHYMVFACYASLAFIMTKSTQTIRTLQSISDQTFYPPFIYPLPVTLVLFSFIPAAFLGYVPITFLLNRGEWPLLAVAGIMSIVITFCARLAWEAGLRRYSSASS